MAEHPEHPEQPERPEGPYAVTLAELEASVHVPVEQQVSEQAEPPPPPPMAPEELDRQRLLGITAAGRLRLP